MSNEREFIENLLNQRFNFFLILFSLVVGGLINTKDPVFFRTILIIGTVLCWLISLTLFRSQKKLDLIMANIKSTDKDHPVTVIDKLAKSSGSRRKIIGYGIPFLCSLILTLGVILNFCGVLIPTT